MNIPKKCPNCGISWAEDSREYLLIRTELNFDSFGEDGRIEDQVYACSKCHTLFRARWKLVSFFMLKEFPLGYHDVEEFYQEDES